MKKLFNVIIVLVLLACILAGFFIVSQARAVRSSLETAFADLEQDGMEGLRPHLAGTAAMLADEVIENPVTDWVNKITKFFTKEEPKGLFDELEFTVGEIMLGIDHSAAAVHYESKPGAEEPTSADCTVIVEYIDHEWKIVNFTFIDTE